MDSTNQRIDLMDLPSLAELFQLFNSGKHLNRLNSPVLWAELEKQQAAYQALFTALGFDLKVDGRGFAWFHSEDSSSNINKNSRQFALLFMVIFDVQADAGMPLNRFNEWRIDTELLQKAYEKHQGILDVEELPVSTLMQLLKSAANFGFCEHHDTYYQLLPAVFRYLDHIEALAELAKEEEDL